MAMSLLIYVDGDKSKTPVDPKTQKPGTRLVLVSPKGRDIHFIAGTTTTSPMSKRKARFEKAKKSKDEG